jgi:peptidase C39-like protein
MSGIKDILALAARASGLPAMQWRRPLAVQPSDRFAAALRDLAETFAALEYELLQVVTACGARPGDTSRLTAVKRDASAHVKKAMSRLPIVSRAYHRRINRWLGTALKAKDAGALHAVFEEFIAGAEAGAIALAAWATATASAALEATQRRNVAALRQYGRQAEKYRRPLLRALRALARVHAGLMLVYHHKIPVGAIKIPVPEVRQATGSTCGASALQAVCRHYGVGPEEEDQITRDMRFDARIGSHPYQVTQTARLYGLRTRELRNKGDITELRACLAMKKPVLLMIQAWGDPTRYRDDTDYARAWNEGHWVVAIGYDPGGFFFEDPSLAGVRGYLSNEDLRLRWRDVGPHNRYMPGYGVAVWKRVTGRPAYARLARHID